MRVRCSTESDKYICIFSKASKKLTQDTTFISASKWYYNTTGTTPEDTRTRGDSVEFYT